MYLVYVVSSVVPVPSSGTKKTIKLCALQDFVSSEEPQESVFNCQEECTKRL